MQRLFNWLAFVAVMGTVGYLLYAHQPQVRGVARMIENKVAPCRRPITYSVGSFDPEFGITKKILVADLKEAEDIWEAPSGKDLFAYADVGGAVTVSLEYDDRQATTDRLNEIDSATDDIKASYEALKARYDSLSARVKSEKAQYDSMVAAYQADPSDRRFREVKAYEATLNADISSLNALASEINQLIEKHNLNVSEYNEVGASTGEFEEGLYRYENGLQTISIYEYSGHTELVRVLAHELGHALGLDHVSDSGSIMYKINHGVGLLATKADIAELNRVCSAGI